MEKHIDHKSIQQKFLQLKALGAGEFAHLNGSLETHLKGTYQLLSCWNASQHVCDAGLFHAAYGTDGFEESMLSLDERQKVGSIIGEEAEQIVYLYCACDRTYVFDGIILNQPIVFKDRFTQSEFTLSEQQAHQFCELTVANELDIAMHSPTFVAQHGEALQKLFLRMSPYLSQAAKVEINTLLGSVTEHQS